MFSQSLFAQLIRMGLLLVVTLFAVAQCQPLMDALAKHATSGGCHQQNATKQDHEHQHIGHH